MTIQMVPMGNGDELDAAAGRCCPRCRNDLTEHNKEVWNAGYAVGQRHAQAEQCAQAARKAAREAERAAWDAGFSACAEEHMTQRRDPEHYITRTNPYDQQDDDGMPKTRAFLSLSDGKWYPDGETAEPLRCAKCGEEIGPNETFSVSDSWKTVEHVECP